MLARLSINPEAETIVFFKESSTWGLLKKETSVHPLSLPDINLHAKSTSFQIAVHKY